MNERLQEIINYIESTCEICLNNLGMDAFKDEVAGYLKDFSTLNDKEKGLLFYTMALINFKLGDIEGALMHWQSALEYAEKSDNKRYIAKTWGYMAVCYYVREDHDKEKEYFENAEEFFLGEDSSIDLALLYINMLFYKRYDKDHDEVKKYMGKAFKYVQKSDSHKNARIYLHLGYIYKTVFDDFIDGADYLIKCVELSHEYNMVEMEAMCYHVLADGYLNLSHYEEAAKIYKDILTSDRFKNITVNLKCAIYANVIQCCFELCDLDRAEKRIKEFKEIIPHTQNSLREPYMAACLVHEAKLLIERGENLETALKKINEAEGIFLDHRLNFAIESFDFKLEKIRGEALETMGNLEKARDSYERLRLYAETYTLYEQKIALEKCVVIYEKLGQYKKALELCRIEEGITSDIEKERSIIYYENILKRFKKNMREKEINELSKKQEVLEQEIYCDSTTGICNKLFFDNYIELLKDSLETVKELTVLTFDIDDFKAYNDYYGHLEGDNCLKKVAEVADEIIKKYDEGVIRFGGEEFIIILENQGTKKAEKIAEEIKEGFKEVSIPHEKSKVVPYITVSMGIGYGKLESSEDIGAVIKAADDAMYDVKRSGKNNYKIKRI